MVSQVALHFLLGNREFKSGFGEGYDNKRMHERKHIDLQNFRKAWITGILDKPGESIHASLLTGNNLVGP